MSYREITAVCAQIHTKHINTLGGQNVRSIVECVVYVGAGLDFHQTFYRQIL